MGERICISISNRLLIFLASQYMLERKGKEGVSFMGLFNRFRNKPTELSIEDKEDYVFEIYKKLDKKCNYKDDLTALNCYERNVYVALMLENDVHEGGFQECFYSQSANYYQEVVASFEELGSYTAADICHRAICALGENIPVNRREREEYYNAVFDDSIDETLYNYEVELKEKSDELTALYYDYIKRYESYFTEQL